MRAPGGAVLSWMALLGIAAAVVSTWWVPQSRITVQSGGPYLVVLTLGYWLSSAVGRRSSAKAPGNRGMGESGN